LLSNYEDVLTAEPGLTDITEFAIETGNTEPIFQRAYNTPASLKDSNDTEIQWLLVTNGDSPQARWNS